MNQHFYRSSPKVVHKHVIRQLNCFVLIVMFWVEYLDDLHLL
jgi:hypothetical protein